MKVQRAYKTEIKVNNKQISTLRRYAAAARFVYNWGLEKKSRYYHLKKHGITARNINFQAKGGSAILTKFKKKKGNEWLKEAPSETLVNSLKDLETAYKNFYRRCKEGVEEKGFPKFKSWRDPIHFHVNYHPVTIDSDYIKLSKIGKIKLKERNYLPVGKYPTGINSVTISEDAGKWYVSIQVEEDITPSGRGEGVVGIDLGINCFAVLSNGVRYEHPRPLKTMSAKIRRVQKSMARSRLKNGGYDKKGKPKKGWKPTKRYLKKKEQLSKLKFKERMIRKDFLHKTTSEVVNKYKVISVEDLSTKRMSKKAKGKGKAQKSGLNKSILDQGWGEFLRQLDYKCEWSGSLLVVSKQDKNFPSTQMCSGCGNIKRGDEKLSLSERVYNCKVCGLVMDRDLNASHNLMAVAIALMEILNARGDDSAGLDVEVFGRPVKVKLSLRSEKRASNKPKKKSKSRVVGKTSNVSVPVRTTSGGVLSEQN